MLKEVAFGAEGREKRGSLPLCLSILLPPTRHVCSWKELSIKLRARSCETPAQIYIHPRQKIPKQPKTNQPTLIPKAAPEQPRGPKPVPGPGAAAEAEKGISRGSGSFRRFLFIKAPPSPCLHCAV